MEKKLTRNERKKMIEILEFGVCVKKALTAFKTRSIEEAKWELRC